MINFLNLVIILMWRYGDIWGEWLRMFFGELEFILDLLFDGGFKERKLELILFWLCVVWLLNFFLKLEIIFDWLCGDGFGERILLNLLCGSVICGVLIIVWFWKLIIFDKFIFIGLFFLVLDLFKLCFFCLCWRRFDFFMLVK